MVRQPVRPTGVTNVRASECRTTTVPRRNSEEISKSEIQEAVLSAAALSVHMDQTGLGAGPAYSWWIDSTTWFEAPLALLAAHNN